VVDLGADTSGFDAVLTCEQSERVRRDMSEASAGGEGRGGVVVPQDSFLAAGLDTGV